MRFIPKTFDNIGNLVGTEPSAFKALKITKKEGISTILIINLVDALLQVLLVVFNLYLVAEMIHKEQLAILQRTKTTANRIARFVDLISLV